MKTIISCEHENSASYPNLQFNNKTGNENLIIKAEIEQAIAFNKQFPSIKTYYVIYINDIALRGEDDDEIFVLCNSKKIKIENYNEPDYYFMEEEDDETQNTYEINIKTYKIRKCNADTIYIQNGKIERKKQSNSLRCGTCN